MKSPCGSAHDTNVIPLVQSVQVQAVGIVQHEAVLHHARSTTKIGVCLQNRVKIVLTKMQ